MLGEDFLWTERFRPHRIADTILPPDLKKTFQQFVDQGNIPNLILAGDPGVGKTTVAKAMLDEMDCDYFVINGSLNANKDSLRNEIADFATSVSFSGKRKYVILDEADYLTHHVQPALRNFMEEHSRNCGFILTCNYKEKIIEPLHSRCSLIEFRIDSKQKPKLAQQFHKRCCDILKKENVSYDPEVVAEVVAHYFPDWRKVLNELQKASSKGPIDTSILSVLRSADISDLFVLLKGREFTKIRKWVAEHSDINQADLYKMLYSNASTYLKPQGVAQLIVLIGKYQYQAALVANAEINMAACLVEIMSECSGDWKE